MEDMCFDIPTAWSLSPSDQDMSFELNQNVHDWNLSSPEYDNIFSKNKNTRVSTLVYDNSPGRDIVPLMTSPRYSRNNVDECSQESKDSGLSDVGTSPSFTNILSFSSLCFSKPSNSSDFQLDDSPYNMKNFNSIKKDKSGKCKRQLKMPSNAGSHSKIRRKLNLAPDLQVQCSYDEDKENIDHVRNKQTHSSTALKQSCIKSSSAVEEKGNHRRGLVDMSNTFDSNRYKTSGQLERGFADVSNSQTYLSDHHIQGFIKVDLDQSEGFINEALGQSEEQNDPIGDFSAQHVLPVIQGRHKDLKTISHNTLSAVLRQEYLDVIGEVTIIDARYPYEYAGGHIEGAINLSTENSSMTELFMRTQPTTSTKRNILIFHCEFSIERGPKMLRFVRSHDRDIHKDTYPQLSYPEIYLLEDGYKSFYMSHPHLCSQGGYRPMLHPDYTEDLRRCRSGSNTSADNKKRGNKASKKTAILQFDE